MRSRQKASEIYRTMLDTSVYSYCYYLATYLQHQALIWLIHLGKTYLP